MSRNGVGGGPPGAGMEMDECDVVSVHEEVGAGRLYAPKTQAIMLPFSTYFLFWSII